MLGYFAGFITSTVLTMGIFAAAYGELTHTLGKSGGANFERGLLAASSVASIAVGVTWIWLTLTGFTME